MASNEGGVRRACLYWARGACHKGEACTFAHTSQATATSSAAAGGRGRGGFRGHGFHRGGTATGDSNYRGRGGFNRGGAAGATIAGRGTFRGRGTAPGFYRGNGSGSGGGQRGRGGHYSNTNTSGAPVVPRAYNFATRHDVTAATTAAASVTGEEDGNEYDDYEGDEGDYYEEEDFEGDQTTADAVAPVKAPESKASAPSSSSSRRPRILLGLTGSVATIKARELVSLLAKFADVQVIVTSSARHFFDEPSPSSSVATAAATPVSPPPVTLLDGTVPVLYDQDEYKRWSKMGDPVLHIDLRNWADLLLIAPLSANTLGKLANGLCDNLLTCVARAWDVTRPVIVAPAMNTHMWRHPLTPRHIALLRKFLRWRILMPMIKRLACNEIGQGAMQSIWSIAAAARDTLGLPVDASLTTSIAAAEAAAAAGVAAAQAALAAEKATSSSPATAAVMVSSPAVAPSVRA